ncbi:hypothetical protein [Methylobacterium sp. 77]|uniref:hypothetical protein n=1 Tax=Methylobacterium sp. 77 TaxID=1101192 RepID=UPI00037DF201|nr:hypothetical protein [Methylobacterium sp. 77]
MSVQTSDRAVEVAQALMEENTSDLFGDDGGAAFRTFLDVRFRGITREDVRRGLEIATECVLVDGRPA